MCPWCRSAGTPHEFWLGVAGGIVPVGRNEEYGATFVTVVEQSFIRPPATSTSTCRWAPGVRHVRGRSSGSTSTRT